MVAGVVLGAGAGSRYGSAPKLIAQLGGRPLLEYAVRSQCAVVELERVIVVLGANSDSILATVDLGRAEPLICPDWSSGQSASLRAAVRALPGADSLVITLGDEPLVTPTAIGRLLSTKPPARASYDGRPGHPVVLGRDQLELVSDICGDRGARDLLGDAQLIDCSDLGATWDVDTPEDLEAVRRELASRAQPRSRPQV